jgi:hypothetical protein
MTLVKLLSDGRRHGRARGVRALVGRCVRAGAGGPVPQGAVWV